MGAVIVWFDETAKTKEQVRECAMRVSYNKLWKLLIDKDMKKMDLLEAARMSPNTLAKLGRNEDVSMNVLRRICDYLQCDVGDIMEMVPEKDEG